MGQGKHPQVLLRYATVFAHIRKDGANFATIDCYSNDNGRFAVKKFMPSLLARPDWQVCFDKDINTIPLLELLAGLPI